MITMNQRGPEIDETQVACFENDFTGPLPSAYREFLLEYNGGTPKPNIIIPGDAPHGPTDIQTFFGLNRSVQTSNILWNLTNFDLDVPGHSLLPIACDSGGNLFVIEKANEKHSVFYYDWTNEEPTLYEIAPGFEEFLTGIRSA